LSAEVSSIQAFLLDAHPGVRLALFRAAEGANRGAILYIHPFAEEMNKSRRMAALQARAFASAGYSVLQIDLFGCGDSSGDFVDARWEIWKDDIFRAAQWMEQCTSVPPHLWGLRLGATLALHAWSEAPDRFASALLWQPVMQPESFMNQFLRLAIAADVVGDTGATITTERLRKQLKEGHTIEVAGYEISPNLVHAIDQLRPELWAIRPGATVSWVDVRRTTGETSPSTRRSLDHWHAAGVSTSYNAVIGDAFWSSFDIIEVPELIAVSTALYAKRPR